MKLIPFTFNTTYHNILISDHSPITFALKVSEIATTQPLWRADPYLLKGTKFCEYLRIQLELFFETNDQPNTSSSLLWDTFKAYLRGCFISFKGAKNKQNTVALQSLERQLNKLDNENATKPSLELHKKILNLRYQYNQIRSEKFSRSLMFMKQKYFEFGDKPHKLLSRQLRKLESDRTIHRIKSKSGAYLLSPIEINNRFKQFYESLYTSNITDDSSTMETFLNSYNLTTLDQEDREFLGADLTLD